MIRQATFRLETKGPGLYEFTSQAQGWVRALSARQGLVNIFVAHTSASLLIQENADPDVMADLQDFFEKLVPQDPTSYRHGAEGPDDMPAHIRSAITQTSISIPLIDGVLGLGVWQGLFLFEHRSAPHRRSIHLTLVAD